MAVHFENNDANRGKIYCHHRYILAKDYKEALELDIEWKNLFLAKYMEDFPDLTWMDDYMPIVTQAKVKQNRRVVILSGAEDDIACGLLAHGMDLYTEMKKRIQKMAAYWNPG